MYIIAAIIAAIWMVLLRVLLLNQTLLAFSMILRSLAYVLLAVGIFLCDLVRVYSFFSVALRAIYAPPWGRRTLQNVCSTFDKFYI